MVLIQEQARTPNRLGIHTQTQAFISEYQYARVGALPSCAPCPVYLLLLLLFHAGMAEVLIPVSPRPVPWERTAIDRERERPIATAYG